MNQVILGVAGSDSHAVANHLIAHYLHANGFAVLNLGVCTPLADFMTAYEQNRNVLAIAIGSLNGHARQDMADLPQLKAAHNVGCPIFLGGNVPHDDREGHSLFAELGVTKLIASPELLLGELMSLQLHRRRHLASGSSRKWKAVG